MANTYNLISSITVGSGGAASISFTSIPQTYTDLLVNLSLRSEADLAPDTGPINLTINGVGTNRTMQWLYGTGSSVGATTRTDSLIGAIGGGTGTTSNTFSSTNLYFPNYTASNFKSFSVDSVMENNATAAELEFVAGLWSATSAITSLSFSTSGATELAQHSTAYLYGISNS